MPVLALATTEAARAVPAEAGAHLNQRRGTAPVRRPCSSTTRKRPGGGARPPGRRRWNATALTVSWRTGTTLPGTRGWGSRAPADGSLGWGPERTGPDALPRREKGMPREDLHDFRTRQPAWQRSAEWTPAARTSMWRRCPAALARRGHRVTVYTRRDAPDLPARVRVQPGLEVVHVDAGPAAHVPKDDLLPFMGALADGIARTGAQRRRTWSTAISGCRASPRWTPHAARPAGSAVPVVQTFHALGTVKRRHQGADDTSPPERRFLEPSVGRSADRIIATCSDEVFELKAMGIDTAQGLHRPVRRGPGPVLQRGPGRRPSPGRTASSPWAGWFRARAWTW